jgi:hypothetical protein
MKLTGPYFIDSHAPEGPANSPHACRAGELGRHGTAR